MKIYIISIAFCLCFCLNSLAQDPVKNVGKLTIVRISDQQINFTTENAFGQITVYSPSIVRVRLDKKILGDDFSYAVIVKPLPTKTSISQTGEQITIITDSLKAVISKAPFSISFYTPDGRLINEDEKGLTTSWIGEEVTTYKRMQEGERFIGVGEKTGNLDRKGSGYTNWNTDAYGYSTGQDPIYATFPFYIGIHQKLNYGIFLDNTFQTDFNFGASNNRFSSFGARGGEMNYYFIYHTRVADIISSYTFLTGRMKLPPLWSLGYQQNRYSYYPETEVYRIAQTLREKKIPADGITLDIHYMDRYQLFTWNKERFPDPVSMTSKLKSMGFRTTVIVDPGIKVETGAAAFERGLKNNVYIKYPDGQNYTGQVWPGWCYFPDFTSEKGRAWWRQEMKFFTDNGISGIWNDMNEIATWGQKMPNNVLFDYDGHRTTHLQAHNVYGMQMARSSYEGARQAGKERPFILTRAGYAGLQRYSAIWTGDNRAEDSHMLLGVRLLNSLGLTGVPFTGMDIGGFTGNPSIALFNRWMQIGAFTPYFRNHTGVNTKSSEPWTYGEEVLEISRNFINLRYRLLPYLYSTFYEATQNGLPVMRTLAINYTHDPEVYNQQFQNQYQFGNAFLVAPFESNKQFGKIYFPQGKWYDLYEDSMEMGGREVIAEFALQKLPVYVKESSIIPMQSLIQSTMDIPSDTLLIHIYKGEVPNSFVYYEDDGISFKNEDGEYYKREIFYDATQNAISFGKVAGFYKSKFRKLKIVFHGFNGINTIKLGDKQQVLNEEYFSFLKSVSQFDPEKNAAAFGGCKVKTIVLDNNMDKFSITY
jgi:alpha-glucosidase